MIKCEVCGEYLYKWECDGVCWYCEQDELEPYVDDSLNEVNMGRFDDDPPEYM
jgi:hypothetical protein